MRTSNRLSLIRKALYSFMLVGVFISTFASGVIHSTYAQSKQKLSSSIQTPINNLISNSLFLYASTVVDFDTQSFLDHQKGALKGYSEQIDGQIWSAAESIEYNAIFYGINPQIILILLEAENNLITQSNVVVPARPNPINEFQDQPKFYYHVKWLVENAPLAFNLHRDHKSVSAIKFATGETIAVSPDINAGTYGLQTLLAKTLTTDKWVAWASGTNPLFRQYFTNWFGDPMFDPDAHTIRVLAIPGEYNLPFPVGNTWYFTGGPHTYTSSGARPWSSVDFAPPEVTACSSGSTSYNSSRWIVAAKGGDVITSKTALVVIDHGDGWRTYYSHISTTERRGIGRVEQNDNLGHPSCEVEPGGSTTGIHVHFAIYQVGTGFVDISGSSLSNWLITETSHYNGTMTRLGVTRTATTGRYNGTNDILNSGSSGGGGSCDATSLPSGYTQCADEGNGNWCNFSGTKQVYYGANSCYAVEQKTNSVECRNESFGGDPLPGVHKACYIQPDTQCPQDGGVILYWNANYNCSNGSGDPGYRQRTSTGLQNVNDGQFNDQASSVKVPGGWSVRLFNDADGFGGGGSVCYSSPVSDFGTQGSFPGTSTPINDRVSSMKVYDNTTCSDVTAPNPPSLSSPGNGSTHPYNYDLTFQWNSSSGATQYLVEWWGGPYTTMQPCEWTSSTSCPIGPVAPGNTYSWHVKARNSAGESNWSSTWNFTIQSTPSYTLNVSKTGSGSGTVTSNPSGINCGSTCSASFTNGTSVTLTATPASGHTFAGWSGACSGTGNTCTVSMTAARSVTATFNSPPNQTLTVSKAGSGTGTVTSSPSGINCGSTCSASFVNGTSVTLTATPTSGHTFAGWSGACTGTGSCTVSMTAARSVTATFNAPGNQPLTVSKTGSGTGTVISNPSGINCGSTCSYAFAYGTSVTLTASPTSGHTFAGWSGACSGTGACIVSMNAAKSVTATFNSPGNRTLTVTRTGTGTGSVSSSPAGINCGSTCSASFAYGTSVTLTATANTGSTFTGWSGACSGTGNCNVNMTATRSVTANFNRKTPVVNVSASPSPASMKSGEYKAITYSFTETAGVSGTITSRTARFYTQSNTALSDLIGPYENDISLQPNGTVTWVDNVYLPPEVVNNAKSAGVTTVVLKTTFEGVTDASNSFSAPASLMINIASDSTVSTLRSVAAQDGWLLESGEASNIGGAMNASATTLLLGDNAQKKQYRSILSFSTKVLPDNAVITKITLRLKQQGIAGGGNPIDLFQGIFFDFKKGYFGSAPGLQAGDFQAAANKTYGPAKPVLTNGWYAISLTQAQAYINKLATGGGVTQIRLRFKLDDNNNNLANYLSLYSGNAPWDSRPQLIIEYYVP